VRQREAPLIPSAGASLHVGEDALETVAHILVTLDHRPHTLVYCLVPLSAGVLDVVDAPEGNQNATGE